MKEKRGGFSPLFSRTKVHVSLMNPEQTVLQGMVTAALLGVLPSLPGDVVVVLPGLVVSKLRDRIGEQFP
jgi:hypothetical protein